MIELNLVEYIVLLPKQPPLFQKEHIPGNLTKHEAQHPNCSFIKIYSHAFHYCIYQKVVVNIILVAKLYFFVYTRFIDKFVHSSPMSPLDITHIQDGAHHSKH